MLTHAALSSCRALSTTVLRLCACLSAGADTLPSRFVVPSRRLLLYTFAVPAVQVLVFLTCAMCRHCSRFGWLRFVSCGVTRGEVACCPGHGAPLQTRESDTVAPAGAWEEARSPLTG